MKNNTLYQAITNLLLKHNLFLIVLLCCFTLTSFNPATAHAFTLNENYAEYIIDNVNIVDVENNKIIHRRQLTIQKGIITSITATGTATKSSIKVINAEGGYLTPGLFDMHVHLHDKTYLMLNLAYGVTSVRSMSGQKMHLRWKKELSNNEWLGSNLYLSSPILAGQDSHLLNQSISTPEEGRHQVRVAQANGFDFIKVYGYLSADIFEAIIDEARKIGIAVAKHGPHPAKGSDWSYLKGLQSVEHVEDIFQGLLDYQFDHEKLATIAKQLKATNVPVVPTLATFDHLTQLSNGKQTFIDNIELDYINPLYRDIQDKYAVQRWLNDDEKQSLYHLKKQQFMFDIVQALNQHQVKLLVGSDAGTMFTIAGQATHEEMRLLKKAGLNNGEILKAATINAAQTLNIDNKYGSISVGKFADLVLVTSNPLEDITVLRHPQAVIKNGQWLGERELLTLKKQAKNTDNYIWSILLLFEDLISRWIS